MLLNEPGLNINAEAPTPLTVVDLPTPGEPVNVKLTVGERPEA